MMKALTGLAACSAHFYAVRIRAGLKEPKKRWPSFYRRLEMVLAEWFVWRWHNSSRKQMQKSPGDYIAAYYRGFEGPQDKKTYADILPLFDGDEYFDDYDLV